MPVTPDIRENSLRRSVERMGYRLVKSRARDPHDATFGRYRMIDPDGVAIARNKGDSPTTDPLWLTLDAFALAVGIYSVVSQKR